MTHRDGKYDSNQPQSPAPVYNNTYPPNQSYYDGQNQQQTYEMPTQQTKDYYGGGGGGGGAYTGQPPPQVVYVQQPGQKRRSGKDDVALGFCAGCATACCCCGCTVMWGRGEDTMCYLVMWRVDGANGWEFAVMLWPGSKEISYRLGFSRWNTNRFWRISVPNRWMKSDIVRIPEVLLLYLLRLIYLPQKPLRDSGLI